MEHKFLHTGLYSDAAYQVISLCIARTRTTIYAFNKDMKKYMSGLAPSFRFSSLDDVFRAPDGEVILKTSKKISTNILLKSIKELVHELSSFCEADEPFIPMSFYYYRDIQRFVGKDVSFSQLVKLYSIRVNARTLADSSYVLFERTDESYIMNHLFTLKMMNEVIQELKTHSTTPFDAIKAEYRKNLMKTMMEFVDDMYDSRVNESGSNSLYVVNIFPNSFLGMINTALNFDGEVDDLVQRTIERINPDTIHNIGRLNVENFFRRYFAKPEWRTYSDAVKMIVAEERMPDPLTLLLCFKSYNSLLS